MVDEIAINGQQFGADVREAMATIVALGLFRQRDGVVNELGDEFVFAMFEAEFDEIYYSKS